MTKIEQNTRYNMGSSVGVHADADQVSRNEDGRDSSELAAFRQQGLRGLAWILSELKQQLHTGELARLIAALSEQSQEHITILSPLIKSVMLYHRLALQFRELAFPGEFYSDLNGPTESETVRAYLHRTSEDITAQLAAKGLDTAYAVFTNRPVILEYMGEAYAKHLVQAFMHTVSGSAFATLANMLAEVFALDSSGESIGEAGVQSQEASELCSELQTVLGRAAAHFDLYDFDQELSTSFAAHALTTVAAGGLEIQKMAEEVSLTRNALRCELIDTTQAAHHAEYTIPVTRAFLTILFANVVDNALKEKLNTMHVRLEIVTTGGAPVLSISFLDFGHGFRSMHTFHPMLTTRAGIAMRPIVITAGESLSDSRRRLGTGIGLHSLHEYITEAGGMLYAGTYYAAAEGDSVLGGAVVVELPMTPPPTQMSEPSPDIV